MLQLRLSKISPHGAAYVAYLIHRATVKTLFLRMRSEVVDTSNISRRHDAVKKNYSNDRKLAYAKAEVEKDYAWRIVTEADLDLFL